MDDTQGSFPSITLSSTIIQFRCISQAVLTWNLPVLNPTPYHPSCLFLSILLILQYPLLVWGCVLGLLSYFISASSTVLQSLMLCLTMFTFKKKSLSKRILQKCGKVTN